MMEGALSETTAPSRTEAASIPARAASRIVKVVEDRSDAPEGWDELTVDVPGGHVLQSRAWASHRRVQGWHPRFLRFDDGRAALVLTRTHRPLPGFIAYAPRGPVAAGDPPERAAARAIALARWIRRARGTELIVDPVLDADPRYSGLLRGAGFVEVDEIQATRHRLVLALPPSAAPEDILKGVSKATRQRIRAAERAGTEIHEDDAGRYFGRFAELLGQTAERKDFSVGHLGAMAAWWRRAVDAQHARFWVALNADRLLGGLLVYRQGGQLVTAYSADDASTRSVYPGTMHLLRWTAIRAALEAGSPSIDLGGVDLPAARRPPRTGEPTFGLYEHKLSFGAAWVESEPAHRIILRPWIHRAGEAIRMGLRAARLRRGRTGAVGSGGTDE